VQVFVTAAFSSAIPKNAPGEIVYIPVGSNRITPSVDGKPKAITVNVPVERGESIAASLQESLSKRLTSPVRPRLAFDHARTGPASAHPKKFSFDPSRGIILALDWSNAGRNAIEGGDYGYFSPSFLINDNGEPAGLPDKGEIGSLVDEPAFRDIGLIAAADASISNPHPQNKMKSVLAHLKIDDSRSDAEPIVLQRVIAMEGEIAAEKSDAEKLKEQIKALQEKLATIEGENEKFKTEASDARKAAGESLFSRAVKAGAAAEKDEAAKLKFITAHETSNATAIELLTEKVEAAEKSKGRGLNESIVNGGEKKPGEKDSGLSGHELLVNALNADIEA